VLDPGADERRPGVCQLIYAIDSVGAVLVRQPPSLHTPAHKSYDRPTDILTGMVTGLP
jgi:hypothetical protein